MEETNTVSSEGANKEDIAADIKPEATTEDKEETKHPGIVWRDTMEEGSIAVCHYSHEVKEKEAKDLKEWRADFDKITTTNINLYVDYPTA
jgi:hypothetical protein